MIYDGDCGFCSSTIRFLEKTNEKGPPFSPYQNSDLESYFLSAKICVEAIQYVDKFGNISSGALAFADYFKDSPFPWKAIGYVLHLPGVKFISDVVYRWVAKNRYFFPGGSHNCGL